MKNNKFTNWIFIELLDTTSRHSQMFYGIGAQKSLTKPTAKLP